MYDLLITAAAVVPGVVLLFGGLYVYRRGIQVFGGLVGAGLAFPVSSTLGLDAATTAAAVVVAGVAGVALARALYVVMVTVPGAATGLGIGVWATGTTLQPVSNVFDPVVLLCAAVGAVLAVVFKQAVVAVLSAVWGSLLVWVGLESQAILDTVIGFTFPTPPTWVLALGAVGLLVQLGTYGYRNDYDEKFRDLLDRLREDEGAVDREAATDTWTDPDDTATEGVADGGTEPPDPETWSSDDGDSPAETW